MVEKVNKNPGEVLLQMNADNFPFMPSMLELNNNQNEPFRMVVGGDVANKRHRTKDTAKN